MIKHSITLKKTLYLIAIFCYSIVLSQVSISTLDRTVYQDAKTNNNYVKTETSKEFNFFVFNQDYTMLTLTNEARTTPYRLQMLHQENSQQKFIFEITDEENQKMELTLNLEEKTISLYIDLLYENGSIVPTVIVYNISNISEI